MCGFFQVVQRNKSIDKDRFIEALDSINHRGPDATGVHFCEEESHKDLIYMGFGHKRLSILDLDKRSNQPFFNKENILLFNGEIYNFKSIKDKYKKEYSLNFNTNSDTEVVAKVLTNRKYDDVTSFNGMWSLSFYDKDETSIILSRDRYGKKPLFYYLDEDTFCVSSTIKAIKKYLGISLEFEEEQLINYLLYGDMFPTDKKETHFKNINQILPGHNSFFSIKEWKIKDSSYFNPYKSNSLNKDFSIDNLAEKLKNSVELRLTSDRPIALLLSGGIDSSLILSILHHYGYSDKVNIFMGDTGRSDDYMYAKKCVNQLNLKAQTIVSDYNKSAFDRFLNICLHHEKAFPFNGNAIAMSQMYEEVSNSDIPVVLDGSGGDEIFGGYWQRHIAYALNQSDKDNELSWKDNILLKNREKMEVKNYKNFIKNDFSIKKCLNPFLKIPFSKIINTKSLDLIGKDKDFSFDEILCKDISPGGRLGDWIWHNDRNSMMYSIESRSPFLDYELHSFIFSGYKNKYKDNWNKYELRKVFDKFTPLPTQWRAQKQGFRWNGKHFFYNNKEEIINLIKESKVLKEYINLDLFCITANRFPKLLKSSLGRRILGIAGIEYMLNKN